MVSKREPLADTQELERAFGMTEEKLANMAGLGKRINMPRPGTAITVRILQYSDKAGNTYMVNKVSNPKFKTGIAYFLKAEEISSPGIAGDVPLSKGLYFQLRNLAEKEGLRFEDLVGKVVTVEGNYWFAAPISKRGGRTCPKCMGKGCEFCTVAGTGEDAGRMSGMAPPKVFTTVLRHDLMGTGVTATTRAVEF